MTYTCTNDRYCADRDIFASVDEFQAMCLAVFGEEAQLTRDGDNYRDETGALVLEAAVSVDGIIDALNDYTGADWYHDCIVPHMTDEDGILWESLVGDRGDRAVVIGRLLELDSGEWVDSGPAADLIVTDEHITALRAEAATHGDPEAVALCDRALDGDEEARSEVEEHIRYTRREAVTA